MAKVKKLNKVFQELRMISVTTDFWKSYAHNIKYMVIITHWVDQLFTFPT